MIHKAVIFDMDGVILDSEPLHVAAFQTTLMNHGKNITEDGYKEHFAGRTDKEGFERYFEFINEAINIPMIMDEKTKNYLRLAADQLKGYPGMVGLIKSLSETHRLALVTGSLREETSIALEALGISRCFQVVVTATDVKHSKPDPEGYVRALELLQATKQDCVIVEDSPNGVKAGKAAGVNVIAVTNTHSYDELSEADKIADHLTVAMF